MTTSKTVLQSRQNKLSEKLEAANLDALVINPSPSLDYLTGLHFHLSERPVIVIFTLDHPVTIILPELEAAKLDDLQYEVRSFPYGENPAHWVQIFKNALDSLGLQTGKVGVEPRGLRYLEMELLQRGAPNAHFESADRLVAALRMYKDPQELEYMQQAVDIAQEALRATMPKIKIGMTEKQIAIELTMQLFQHGSNPKLPFFPIVSGGPNSANPHASPSERKITAGDLLVIDYGANVNGYLSDITRTFAIGEVDSEYHHIAEIVLGANIAGRAAVKPGVTASRIDQAARSVIENAGYGDYFIHRTGHGLGLEGHEYPYIRDDNDFKLEPGITFTVEPGIYLPGRNGVRIEDNVVVTTNSLKCLTSLPRELITLG
jgi:Xaa-Pro dipeptidase